LNGECGAPDTPGSQPGFAGHHFHGEKRSAHHRARIRAARWLLRPKLSIPIAPKQKARREAGLWVEALNRRQRVADAIN
jgi:hypothetical protein